MCGTTNMWACLNRRLHTLPLTLTLHCTRFPWNEFLIVFYVCDLQGYVPQAQYPGAAYGQPHPMGQQYVGQQYVGQQYAGQPTTITVQPTVLVARTPLAHPLNDYLGYSIFTMLCCCLPLGIAALVYSIFVSLIRSLSYSSETVSVLWSKCPPPNPRSKLCNTYTLFCSSGVNQCIVPWKTRAIVHYEKMFATFNSQCLWIINSGNRIIRGVEVAQGDLAKS